MTKIFDVKGSIDKNILKKACDIIHNDGIVGLSTDTIFGLAFDSSSKKALNTLMDIKKRENDVFTYHIGNIEQLINSDIKFDKKILNLLKNTLPARITYIIQGINKGESAYYGIRYPKNQLSSDVFSQFLFPSIVATSCNLTGMSPLNKRDEVIDFLSNRIPMLIFDENSSKTAKASTIIKIFPDYSFELLREGDIPFKDISKKIIDFLV